MTNIEDICQKLEFFKQILLSNNHHVNVDKSMYGSNVEVHSKELNCLDRPDYILDLATKVFVETQRPNPNISISNYQIEPLDLSQKQNPIAKEKATEPLPKRLWKPKTFDFDKFFSTYIKRFTANDVCSAHCQMLYKDHYHCFAENGNCNNVMKGKDQLRQHGKRHCIAEELTKLEFKFCLGCRFTDNKRHFHCSHDNCYYTSTGSNMDRLEHVETAHCIIISKRTNSNGNMDKQYSKNKRRRKTQNYDDCVLKELTTADICSQLSPISSVSSDNQFIDFNHDSIINTINKNNCLSMLEHLSPERNNIVHNNGLNERDTSLQLTIKEDETNFYQNASCARLFCNLKKGDHYHCPICDRGSSKKELYERHLKQRHK